MSKKSDPSNSQKIKAVFYAIAFCMFLYPPMQSASLTREFVGWGPLWRLVEITKGRYGEPQFLGQQGIELPVLIWQLAFVFLMYKFTQSIVPFFKPQPSSSSAT